MSRSDGGLAPGYNVRISTDAKEKVIVAVDISQSASDQTLLPSALDRLQNSTASYPGQIVADGGLTTREAILAAHTRGVDLIGSFPDSSGKMTTLVCTGISEAFYPECFIFDHERNV